MKNSAFWAMIYCIAALIFNVVIAGYLIEGDSNWWYFNAALAVIMGYCAYLNWGYWQYWRSRG